MLDSWHNSIEAKVSFLYRYLDDLEVIGYRLAPISDLVKISNIVGHRYRISSKYRISFSIVYRIFLGIVPALIGNK